MTVTFPRREEATPAAYVEAAGGVERALAGCLSNVHRAAPQGLPTQPVP